ncbi:Kinesin-like protein NACK2 [Capsicum baccatum]|uniref:Kinesin-like protein NACK2 n=1 Tax=Capsicum baccatum TaxID=33114 RepID=A0A2G2X3D7_CAPBA|nr:Kinesin-like protein NACK2 [Capsicum baccatum]
MLAVGRKSSGRSRKVGYLLSMEREYLAKRVRLKLIADEREMFYVKWDIPPESRQRRRLQLASKLWTDPLNMQNVSESAEVVTELVGFRESGEHVSAQFCFPL